MNLNLFELILPRFLWRQGSMSPEESNLLAELRAQMSQEETDLTHRGIIVLFTWAELAERNTPKGRTGILTKVKRELRVEARRFRKGHPAYDSGRLKRLARLVKALSPAVALSAQGVAANV